MSGEIVVGLDVGATKVTTIVGETMPGGGVEITGFGEAPCTGLRRGSVVDVPATVSAIRKSIAQAEKRAQVEISSVTLGVTGEHIASMTTRGVVAISPPESRITEADLQRVMAEATAVPCPPDRRILHALPLRYMVDGARVNRPVGMVGSRLEVETHIVTAIRSAVDNLLNAVEGAGRSTDPDGVVLAALASGEAVLSAEERELGVAMADIGEGVTDVLVYQGGALLHSGVIPVGGWHVTHDLSEGLKVSEEEAERIKLSAGVARPEDIRETDDVMATRVGGEEPDPIPRTLIAEITSARMEELMEMIVAEVGKAGPDAAKSGLVLTGGGALVPGSVELAHSMMKETEVRIGLPRCVGGIADQLARPGYATAVGLLMLAGRRHHAAEVAAQENDHLLSPVHDWMKRWLRRLLGKG